MCLLNFYVSIYLIDNVQEYAHVINCNVLSRELTYRYILSIFYSSANVLI
jgi:hypothetical protein